MRINRIANSAMITRLGEVTHARQGSDVSCKGECRKAGLGLVLGSGSARGLVHIGVLKVWEREQLPLDLIVGTSIGALVGGVYACGVTALEMEEIALSMDMRRLVSLADVRLPSTALLNGRRVERFIRELVDGKSFADTQVPFACVAVDLEGGREVVLRKGDLATAIRASISTPVIFAPTRREGLSLVDGAVLNPVPVDVAKDLGADLVVAVTTFGNGGGLPPLSGPVAEDVESGEIREASLSRTAYSKATSLVRQKVGSPAISQTASGSIGLMQRGLSRPRLQAADLVIAPDINGVSPYGFREAEKIIAMGERAAEKAVGAVERFVALEAALSG
jgi:NTE family protein